MFGMGKKKSAEPPPAEPAWSAGDAAAPTDGAPDVAIPAAHETSPAAARPASLRLRKAAAKLTGVHGAFSPRATPDETDEQRAAADVAAAPGGALCTSGGGARAARAWCQELRIACRQLIAAACALARAAISSSYLTQFWQIRLRPSKSMPAKSMCTW